MCLQDCSHRLPFSFQFLLFIKPIIISHSSQTERIFFFNYREKKQYPLLPVPVVFFRPSEKFWLGLVVLWLGGRCFQSLEDTVAEI